MRKLKVNTFVTLDGVMQAPGGPDEDRSGGFTQIFAAHWPDSTEPAAEILNSARKHVASRTLRSVDWNNSTLINGDVGKYVSELKEQSGPEIQVHGSGDLLQTLLKNDLVDEFHVWTFPVVLGSGKRLFADGAVPAGLKVDSVKTSTTGVVIATYQRAGAIKYGSFALEEPTAEQWTSSSRS